jgi:hypothetical protein
MSAGRFPTNADVIGTLTRVTFALALASMAGVAFAAPAWPLKIDATGRHLESQNGTPFLIAADTAWCMVNGLTDSEIDTYLAARKAQGFNAIQFMLMAKHSGCAAGGGSTDRYGHAPFATGDADWSIPSEAYWARVDTILNKVKAQDMLALVTPAYLGYTCYDSTQGWCAVMDAQSAQRMAGFGTFLGNRYSFQGNIIWIAGGDANPMAYSGMDAKVDALMSALAAADISGQIVTGHAGRHVSAFQGFGTHAWLTMNSAYDGESCPDASMAPQIATEYARAPVQPLLSIEQLYDQEGASAACLANQFLWSALGGGVGQSYGNGVVWNFAASWNDQGTGINSPLALVHTNSAKLVRSRKFWLFAPDYAHSAVVAGYGSGSATVAASRASTGETIMAYIPVSGTAVTIDMTKLSGTTATAYWYDPIAGSATLIGSYATSGTRSFTSPGPARALILDDASKQYPAPASADAVFDGVPLDEVEGVSLSKLSGAVRVSWVSQSAPAGSATSYDLVTGRLSDLRASGGYDSATCLANGVLNTPYDDTEGNPLPGEGYYQLVRASDDNGAGSYGPAALDSASPCP